MPLEIPVAKVASSSPERGNFFQTKTNNILLLYFFIPILLELLPIFLIEMKSKRTFETFFKEAKKVENSNETIPQFGKFPISSIGEAGDQYYKNVQRRNLHI